MQHPRDLTPCLIGTGTVTGLRDMVRAMETVEAFDYRYSVDGENIAEGRATLVKIMADPDSSTLLVNGCLFLNVASFRYLNFAPAEEPEAREGRPVMRFMEDPSFDIGSFVTLDDEEDED
jgi:hypothetical protein